jgi:hypothetical protein
VAKDDMQLYDRTEDLDTKPLGEVRLLFLTANPKWLLRGLDEEYNQIVANLEESRYKNRFKYQRRDNLTKKQLLGILLRNQSEIVHFSGSGTKGGLILSIESNSPDTVDIVDFVGLIEDLNRDGKIRCVFLNACNSSEMARQISKFVDCVVGVEAMIYENAAIEFASQFYLALAEGKSIGESHDLAKRQLKLSGFKTYANTVLKCRKNVDPYKIKFIYDKPIQSST